ncbi:MAG: inositol monophosphatase family protein [Candidatus Kariarchaeaceae archaeon]
MNKALHKARSEIMFSPREKLLKEANQNAAGQQAIVADVVAEREFLQTLINQNLHGVLYSEESGVKLFGNPTENDDNSIILMLDPLDGSQNFLKGITFGCISVAYGAYVDDPRLSNLDRAAILNLYADDLFTAKKGSGAYFNGQKITRKFQSRNPKPRGQISYYTYGLEPLDKLEDLMAKYSLRSLGSAAWELALITIDRNDAFVDVRGVLKAHDYAAARIVLEEVGGVFKFLPTNGPTTPDEIPLTNFKAGYSIIASKDRTLVHTLVQNFQN